MAVPHPRCEFIGPDLTPEQTRARGLRVDAKRWHYCESDARPLGEVVCGCAGCGPACPGYEPGVGVEPPPVRLTPLRRTRIDDTRLANGTGELHLNASLAHYKGRWLLAYRSRWSGAQVNIAELDYGTWAVKWTRALPALKRDGARGGREDSRLFIHGGRLHVGYTGVDRVLGKTVTNQMFARLSDDLKIEDAFFVHYAKRKQGEWMKNCVFWDHGGDLYMLYDSAPQHVVLRVRSNDAELAHATSNLLPWSGGARRGGASPVPGPDGLLWHWFHGSIGGYGAGRVYNVGVYCFEPEPPFRVVRGTIHPLLVADPATKPVPTVPSVVFPCGAVHHDGRWLISAGIHDHWIEVLEFDHKQVEPLLVTARR